MSITIPIQTGTAIASDVVAGDVVPKTKVVFGANGTATDVTTDVPLPTKDTTVKTSVDAVKTSADAVKSSVDTVKTSVDAVKTSADAVKTSTDAVKSSTDAVKSAVDKISSSADYVTITPSDSVTLSGLKGIYVGVEGNLVVQGTSNVSVTFKVQAGQILPIAPVRVMAATTATSIIGLK